MGQTIRKLSIVGTCSEGITGKRQKLGEEVAKLQRKYQGSFYRHSAYCIIRASLQPRFLYLTQA